MALLAELDLDSDGESEESSFIGDLLLTCDEINREGKDSYFERLREKIEKKLEKRTENGDNEGESFGDEYYAKDLFCACLMGKEIFLKFIVDFHRLGYRYLNIQNHKNGRVPSHFAHLSRSFNVHQKSGDLRNEHFGKEECASLLMNSLLSSAIESTKDSNGAIWLHYLVASNIPIFIENEKELSFSSLCGSSSSKDIFEFIYEKSISTKDKFLSYILNRTKAKGLTPLHSAALIGDEEIFMLMFNRLKSIMLEGSEGEITRRFENHSDSFLTKDVEHRFSSASIFYLACYSGSLSIVNQILSDYEKRDLSKRKENLLELVIFGKVLTYDMKSKASLFNYASIKNRTLVLNRLFFSTRKEILSLVDMRDSKEEKLLNNPLGTIEKILEIAKLVEYPIEEIKRMVVKSESEFSTEIPILIEKLKQLKLVKTLGSLEKLFKRFPLSFSVSDSLFLHSLRDKLSRFDKEEPLNTFLKDLLNAKNNRIEGLTPIQFVSLKGRTGVLKELLKFRYGDESVVDAEDKEKDALYYALSSNNIGVVEILLDHGIGISEKHLSVLHKFSDINKANLIIEKAIIAGGDIAKVTIEEKTMLDLAMEAKNVDLAIDLLARGIKREGQRDINEKIDGNSLIHVAVKKGNLRATMKLMKAQGSILNDSRESIFHIAASEGHDEILRKLYRSKVDKRVKDKNGYLPIHHAVKAGKIEAVKVILDRDIDSVAESFDPIEGKGILDLSLELGENEILKILLYDGNKLREYVDTIVKKENLLKRAFSLANNRDILKFLYKNFKELLSDSLKKEILALAIESNNVYSLDFIIDSELLPPYSGRRSIRKSLKKLLKKEEDNKEMYRSILTKALEIKKSKNKEIDVEFILFLSKKFKGMEIEVINDDIIKLIIESNNFDVVEKVLYTLHMDNESLNKRLTFALKNQKLKSAAAILDIGGSSDRVNKSDLAIISAILNSCAFAESVTEHALFLRIYEGQSVFSLCDSKDGSRGSFISFLYKNNFFVNQVNASKVKKVEITTLDANSTSSFDLTEHLVELNGGKGLSDNDKEIIYKDLTDFYCKIVSEVVLNNISTKYDEGTDFHDDEDIKIGVENDRVIVSSKGRGTKLTREVTLRGSSFNVLVIEVKL